MHFISIIFALQLLIILDYSLGSMTLESQLIWVKSIAYIPITQKQLKGVN